MTTDSTPTRRSFGEALTRLRGPLTSTRVARMLPNARGGTGMHRQALDELEGTTCPTCKGAGAGCDECGGRGRVWKGNPTLSRIEDIAGALGVVAEVVFVYPPGHPSAGQIVTGLAPGLEPLVQQDQAAQAAKATQEPKE